MNILLTQWKVYTKSTTRFWLYFKRRGSNYRANSLCNRTTESTAAWICWKGSSSKGNRKPITEGTAFARE